MTGYRRDELEQGWEFKILRSSSGAFKNPRVLVKVLHEEAIAGWNLLEKFDNRRIRLKRLVAARANDAQLPVGYDPYRTRYGMNSAYVASIIVAAIMVAGILVGWLTGGI
jgi:hypothetical protein